MSADSIIRSHYFKFERGEWTKDGDKPATHLQASGFAYTNALTLAQRNELDALIRAFMRKIDGTLPASETAEPSGARTLLGLPVTIDGSIPSDEAHLAEPEGTRHRITNIDSAEPSGAALSGGQAAGWLPIATVPKDGREVILREGARVGAANWCHWPTVCDAAGAIEQDSGEGWTMGADGNLWISPDGWMPMPAAQPTGNTGQLQAAEGVSERQVGVETTRAEYAWPGPGPEPARWVARDGTIVYRSYEDYCDD